MKIVYIDFETTGLDPDHDQAIELGMVIDDLMDQRSVVELPCFHAYIKRERYIGTAYCFAMHTEIFKILAEDKHPAIIPEMEVYANVVGWLIDHLKPEKPEDFSLNVGGKNVARFDLCFLLTLPGFTEENHQIKIGQFRVGHRVMDPAPIFAKKDDRRPPDLNTCLARAGIEKRTTHTAVEDCLLVAELIRKAYDHV